jgi:asparagine synthase (glutamine-hydrolysing)
LRARLAGLAHSPELRESAVIELGTVRRLTAEHLSGARDHGRTLWSLIMFDAFLKLRIDSSRNAEQRLLASA